VPLNRKSNTVAASTDFTKQGVQAIMPNILNGLAGLGIKKIVDLDSQKPEDPSMASFNNNVLLRVVADLISCFVSAVEGVLIAYITQPRSSIPR
jgi:hypothetical protein